MEAEMAATHRYGIEMNAFFTVPEVMKLLHLSEGTTRKLLATGDLPGKRFATAAIRVRGADLVAYIESVPDTTVAA